MRRSTVNSCHSNALFPIVAGIRWHLTAIRPALVVVLAPPGGLQQTAGGARTVTRGFNLLVESCAGTGARWSATDRGPPAGMGLHCRVP